MWLLQEDVCIFVCVEVFQKRCGSSGSVSAHQGQASSERVFLKQTHWSAAIQFVSQRGKGVGGQDEMTETIRVLVRDGDFLLHSVLNKFTLYS